ncbi:MAG: hypothetical protein U5J95_09735 [Balneolaceae bacterium]|nr:hypothetical protein [Balneolaceae bacterium]
MLLQKSQPDRCFQLVSWCAFFKPFLSKTGRHVVRSKKFAGNGDRPPFGEDRQVARSAEFFRRSQALSGFSQERGGGSSV